MTSYPFACQSSGPRLSSCRLLSGHEQVLTSTSRQVLMLRGPFAPPPEGSPGAALSPCQRSGLEAREEGSPETVRQQVEVTQHNG